MSKPKKVKETQSQKAQVRRASELAKRYFGKVAPVEAATRERVLDKSNVANAIGLGIINRQAELANVNRGLGLLGGKSPAALATGVSDIAQQFGLQAGGMSAAANQNQISNAAALVAQGQGEQSAGVQSINQLAERESRQAMIKAEAANAARAANSQLFGTVAGLGASFATPENLTKLQALGTPYQTGIRTTYGGGG